MRVIILLTIHVLFFKILTKDLYSIICLLIVDFIDEI